MSLGIICDIAGTLVMGLYDEICFEVPLPDSGTLERTYFQTKSVPDPRLQRFTVTKAGRLIDARGNDLKPDGYIEFYTTEHVGNAGDTKGKCALERIPRPVLGRAIASHRAHR